MHKTVVYKNRHINTDVDADFPALLDQNQVMYGWHKDVRAGRFRVICGFAG